MSAAIKQVLNEYIKIDDELKTINKQCSTLRTQKKLLGEQIYDYMESTPAGTNAALELGTSVFKLVKYTKKKVGKNNLEEILKKKIKNESHVKDLMEEITEETEESYIKRSVKK